jgi:hypothetical protein
LYFGGVSRTAPSGADAAPIAALAELGMRVSQAQPAQAAAGDRLSDASQFSPLTGQRYAALGSLGIAERHQARMPD